jgi:hypothetical protein
LFLVRPYFRAMVREHDAEEWEPVFGIMLQG